MDLELYGYFRSSSSWRVRIALAWKGLTWTDRPVHLLRDGGEQHRPEHRARNPMEQVPVLVVGGEAVAQSMAILELLEELAPEPALLPKAPLDRARVRQMAEVVNSGIQPVQNLRVLQKLEERLGADSGSQGAWARAWIEEGFGALEELVARHGGDRCFGDQVTFADVMLVPQLFNARRFHVELTQFPRLLAVETGLLALPAFHHTRPEAQPDAGK